MNLTECYDKNKAILIEGALGVRLRSEYSLYPESKVANASFIYQDKAKRAMQEIYRQYIGIADTYQLPIMLTTPTRRANKRNVAESEYSENIIQDNVAFLRGLQEEFSGNIYVGGLMGCKGDAYKGTEVLSITEAHEFHSWQAQLFGKAKADFLFAGVMPVLSEAIGMAKAMEASGLPYIISFMIRENGCLIDGTSIHDAMTAIEEATNRKPLCYMTNCVHPIILGKALTHSFNQTDLVRTRFKGIQANASPLSPEELDQCCELKSSNPIDLAEEMIKLRLQYDFQIFGGCCGTDQTHMEELARRLK
ncbi:MAG: homocysteine S-methyltransferase [Herbinix sp.]|jgi:S-methylmethionine-dependent homocysteine/selenocysteine methylase|nr:homocysteine S-methyltransferase [Herbinix sp.]